jgi:NAD(P)-dependent dehydrogenase (short-subunit alcohol dehydrogenase family)
MELRDAVVVVTGGGSGIGAALCRRAAREGARGVVVADLDAAAATELAAGLAVPALGIGVDVTDAAQVAELVRRAETELGPVDLLCANAGVALGVGLGADEDWERSWSVNVMGVVHCVRAVLPSMLARGRGHLLVTASAAGLLTNLDTASYSATKHAAVALAEWLAIIHGDDGIGVSCLCPQAVRTPMTAHERPASATLASGALLEPDDVADAVVAALREGRFLVLPHAEVAERERHRTADRDRWLRGMRKWRRQLGVQAGPPA